VEQKNGTKNWVGSIETRPRRAQQRNADIGWGDCMRSKQAMRIEELTVVMGEEEREEMAEEDRC
jgi:hypothetical protein